MPRIPQVKTHDAVAAWENDEDTPMNIIFKEIMYDPSEKKIPGLYICIDS